ncbi:MAG: S8 family serine peptidase [Eubacteriales bacterium]|nr:S8 family serine peptidase [Eubacteriales bacterium]
MIKRWKTGMATLMVGMLLTTGMTAEAANQLQITKKWNSQNSNKTLIQMSKKKQNKKKYAEGQVIVMYGDGKSATKAFSANSLGSDITVAQTYSFDVPSTQNGVKANAQGTTKTNSVRVSLVKSNKYTTEQLIKMLSARKDIRYVEPNYRYEVLDNDYSGFQWALNNVGQNAGTAGMDVNPEYIKQKASDDEGEKVIALVDTGMDYKHPDLASKVWNNPFSEKQLKGKHGYDVVNNDDDPIDDHGHGTHCAGIMAGVSGDNSGISGVTNDEHIKIMPIKILDESGSCYGFESVGAYNYIYRAQQLGVNIVSVNNSWGASGYIEPGEEEWMIPESKIFTELVNMVGEAGAVTVCAAGNDGEDNGTEGYINFPSNIDSPYVISVAASNEDGELATFSCYGDKEVDIAAPGADILSTVSYDVFNPGIYSDQKRSQVCTQFNDFETATNQDVASYRTDVKGKATSTVSVASNEYFGKESTGKSLHWSLKNAEQDREYILYVPYDQPIGLGTAHVSTMVRLEDKNKLGDGELAWWYGGSVVMVLDGIVDNGKKPNAMNFELVNGAMAGNCWSHTSAESYIDVEEDGQRYLAFVIEAASNGDYDLYIDNIGVSKAVNDTSVFEHYDYYNGTSMATPYVTGAVAAVAQAYPEMTALERKSVILSCSKKTDDLAGKVLTGGTLDFSLIGNPRMFVSDISLNDDKNIEIEGAYLDGAEVTINNAKIEPMSADQDTIVIAGKDMMNKRLHIALKKGDDVYEEDCYFAQGNALQQTDMIMGSLDGSQFTSDGNAVYSMDDYGTLYFAKKMMMGEDSSYPSYTLAYEGFTPSCLGEKGHTWLNSIMTRDSNVVCCNGGVWTVVNADAGFESMKALAYVSQDAIQATTMYMPVPGDVWSFAAELPEAVNDLSGLTIAAYNGQIYLMGGFNETTGAFNKNVYRYNVSATGEQKWQTVAALPEGRAFAQGIQVGNKLVVTLGAKDLNGTSPANLVFDGSAWKVSKVALNANTNATYEYGKKDEEKKLEYYTADISMVKDAVAYLGIKADGMSDVFNYNVAKDAFQTTNYILDATLAKKSNLHGVAVNDQFSVLVPGGEGVTNVYTCPIKTGWITSKISYSMYDMPQTEVRNWLPCDQITLTPPVMDGFYVDTFKVAGKKVKANEAGMFVFKAMANKYPNGISATVNYKPYVSMITMLEESMQIPVGGKAAVLNTVMPDDAQVTNLKWESDNSLIKVDQNGVVTVSKKAKVGDTATITVTAMDRGIVSASIQVTVVEKPAVPAKGKTAKVGKFTYKVTKSAEKNGTVTCVKMNNKNFTKITVPSTVSIDGYTFKVTKIADKAFKSSKKLTSITIGANVKTIGKDVCKSCGKLKTVTIKSSKITKIGKGSFNSINKKAVVKVPKKKKDSYKKLLKNAGCKATVKA